MAQLILLKHASQDITKEETVGKLRVSEQNQTVRPKRLRSASEIRRKNLKLESTPKKIVIYPRFLTTTATKIGVTSQISPRCYQIIQSHLDQRDK